MNPTIVIDASVVAKWCLPEPDSDRALVLLQVGQRLAAPDLLFAEVASTLWKAVRRGELSLMTAENFLDNLRDADLEIHPLRGLATEAFRLAVDLGISVYDACYIILARELGTRCVTADRKLFDLVRRSHLRDLIAWIADEPLFLM